MKQYYLGLDMGTSSVGWAVTDENYKIMRAKGKDLWGIREFDEAMTAAERRTNRISRRRRQREVARIGLLKEYFADAIESVDPTFYQRLENSKYHLEDKDEKAKYKSILFVDKDYSDKDYYAQYPTIFHLRNELLTSNKPHDVRLVFLALLNMYKHRGHFLNMSLSSTGAEREIEEVFREFTELLQEECSINLCENYNYERIKEILTNSDFSRKRKVEELSGLFGYGMKEKKKIEFLKCICGLKVNAKNLFDDLVVEDDKKIEFSFSDASYEEKTAEIETALGQSYYAVVEIMKEVYDSSLLASIMNGYAYLSEARVADYEKHAKDLKILKKVIKKYRTKAEYDEFFRSEKGGTYSAYVNSFNSGDKRRRTFSDRKPENLYKSIRQMLAGVPEEDADVAYVLDEIAKENFLPKQLTASNGVIPNQVHAREMAKILENAECYLPFLKETDESGFTVSERILKLFSFQIPYYIGPTSEDSKTGWVMRLEKGNVLPWNLEQKIDVKETSEKFISRMVRRCTYINGEMVLPKGSLEYESFCVLNEINNISIDGERISTELKQDIYNELFKKGKKVTKNNLVKFLFARGALVDENQLSGIDITINSSLSTYGKFKAILGEKIEEDFYKHMVEELVFWCTIYGDTKSFLREKIKENYSVYLSDEQINRITGFKFKDWGRLSKEFLELQGCDKTIGESVSLIRMMWDTNLNLMELINSEHYTYREALIEKQDNVMKTLSEMKSEDLDECYFSAPVKRMVWQTLLIIKELETVLGNPPERLFVEMARNPEDRPQRTVSRKQKFLQLYRNIKENGRDWKGEIEKADADGSLNSKKMYLYFTQMGRCMYSGEIIDLSNLGAYDIDHIYPRHYVKDDNLDNNLVLVKKVNNAHKSDTYPVEESIRIARKELWDCLKSKNLISEEKYKRLVCRNPFTEEQKAEFIARQLVETRQGTKGVADVLKKVLPETTIVFSKASNVSEFRQTRNIPKCRLINEFHHAHDAYLNIVVGNVYYTKFTQNPLHFIKKEYAKDKDKYRYNLSRMFDWDVVRNGKTAWVGAKPGEESGTIVLVKQMLAKNTPLMTRRNFEEHGEIAKINPVSAKKATNDNYMPLKGNDERLQDVEKYGGFQRISISYFCLIEHGTDGKRIRTIEGVPVYLRDVIEKDSKKLLEYCSQELGLINPRVCMPKIKKQSLIKKDGYLVHLSAKSGEQINLRNAVNLCLSNEWSGYIKLLENSGAEKLNSGISQKKNVELYDELTDKHLNSIYAKRANPMGQKLCDKRNKFVSLSIQEQCELLKQVLKLSAIGITEVDLGLLEAPSRSGGMSMSKRIDRSKEIVLINQSVTGLFENRIDLLTV